MEPISQDKQSPQALSTLPARNPDGTLKPGHTANPNGTHKSLKEIRELARGKSRKSIEVLAEIMEDKKAKNRDRIVAASIILDRAYGKPAQEFRLSDKLPDENNLGQLSNEELDALEITMAKIAVPIVQENIAQEVEYIPPPDIE